MNVWDALLYHMSQHCWIFDVVQCAVTLHSLSHRRELVEVYRSAVWNNMLSFAGLYSDAVWCVVCCVNSPCTLFLCACLDCSLLRCEVMCGSVVLCYVLFFWWWWWWCYKVWYVLMHDFLLFAVLGYAACCDLLLNRSWELRTDVLWCVVVCFLSCDIT